MKDFIDRTLAEAPFSSRHILNFLHNGPSDERPADVPDFDWRHIFNLTDRVVRMLNQYGDVSVRFDLGCQILLPHSDAGESKEASAFLDPNNAGRRFPPSFHVT